MTAGRRGFTLIEVVLVAAILTIVAIKFTAIWKVSTEINKEQSVGMALEDQARRVLDRIAFSIMGSDPARLTPDLLELPYSDSVRYQLSLGVDDGGEEVWSDIESVALVDHTQVVWRRKPDDEDGGLRVAWCNAVRENLEGELPNGVDDNGNGLVDEPGLTFTLDRKKVVIRLTLEKTTDKGKTLRETVETMVTLRN